MSPDGHLYHITTRERWNDVVEEYTAPTQDEEGFIHCSTRDQVEEVANRIFRGQTGLVLLRVDRDRVGPEIVFENLEGGSEQYPHIYGPLDAASVTGVADLTAGPDGTIRFPETFDGGENG